MSKRVKSAPKSRGGHVWTYQGARKDWHSCPCGLLCRPVSTQAGALMYLYADASAGGRRIWATFEPQCGGKKRA